MWGGEVAFDKHGGFIQHGTSVFLRRSNAVQDECNESCDRLTMMPLLTFSTETLQHRELSGTEHRSG